jgi:hypothetical protein
VVSVDQGQIPAHLPDQVHAFGDVLENRAYATVVSLR